MQRSRIGPFVLEECLDPRGSANVLRGLHVERKTAMAVKLLPPSLVNQAMGGNLFAADVKRLQKLVHPSIVRYLGGTIEDGQPYLALELVPGESLRDLMDRRGKIPWELAVEITDGICEALRHAHQHGFVHQRLTPSRVLLPEGGGVKLAGFDCAWGDRDEVLGLRSSMEVAPYLAPEVFRGKQSATLPPCDLFSLGVILYECLAGELPWSANTPSELIQARRAGPAPRIAPKVLDCPVWLDVLVAKLLEPKRADRLSSAEEAHRAIVSAMQKVAAGVGATQQALAGKSGVLRVGGDQKELRKLSKGFRRKHRDTSPFYERAWFLGVCLLLLVAGAAWTLRPADEDALFEGAKPYMDSESPVDWKRAEEQYIKPLLAQYPDTKYADEIQEFEDRYLVYRAQTRAKNNDRLGRPAESEAERLYTEAWDFEKRGDRITAWQRYEALATMFNKSDDEYDRAFAGLARQRISNLRSDPQDGKSQADFVRDQLAQSKSLIQEGDLYKARRILDGIVSSYKDNRELQPLVDQARVQIQNLTKD
ncbi:serine/threonine protein kinase [Bythopirellula goksoeyrii]|uniref:mitogen-activated protein kinase kinase n=1 Tax=Bythopirellula goksoeyrii TaxID=1400387 RepID=A0A5B9QFU2_9BACT|nr:serine/threonine-protein kinase [Bythopirellula goksoeyrii]QEG37927.1 Serine/threonine-protein kinase PK-1 [Bythopirellula goksoeyrii]